MLSRLFPQALYWLAVVAAAVPATEAAPATASGADGTTYDVIVLGATPAGIATAVTAERQGLEAVVIADSHQVGGLFAAAQSEIDLRSPLRQGGFSREFFNRILQNYAFRYGQNASQVLDCSHGHVFGPQVATDVLAKMLEESGVDVLPRHRLIEAKMSSIETRPKLQSVLVFDLDSKSAVTLQGRAFVDATYHGELVGMARGAHRQSRDDSVVPESNGARPKYRVDAIAISGYEIDGPAAHDGIASRKREILESASGPYQFSYGTLIPDFIDALIVPIQMPSTEIGSSRIRWEPVWMSLGQASGYAIAQALTRGVELRDVDVALLQQKLCREGAIIFYTTDVYPDSPYFESVQFFGNRGLFENLPVAGAMAASADASGSQPQNGRFDQIAGHTIDPHQLMSEELAEHWIGYINSSFDRSLSRQDFATEVERYSRGRFLNRLYSLFRNDSGDVRPLPDSAAQAARPNIILILADDLGIETLNAYGGATYPTPNLDRLAQEGARFSHAYATPLCTPSRVQLLSGLYPARTGWPSLIHKRPREDRYVSPEITNVAQVLRRAGYGTCISGKWQLGYLGQDPDHPHKMGFDEYSLWEWRDYETFELYSCYGNPVIRQNGSIREDTQGKFGPDVHAEFILDYIRRKRNQPWFVFYPMIFTHFPFVPTPELWDGKTPPPEAIGFPPDQGEPNYFPWMVKHMDRIIGRLLETLEATDQLDSSLIVFVGDNGTDPKIKSSYHGRWVQGDKGELTSRGCRVPLIARHPRSFPQGHVSDALVDLADIFPTLLAAAGVEYQGLTDGTNLRETIEKSEPPSLEFAFTQLDDHWRIWNHRIAVDDLGRIFNVSSPLAERSIEHHSEASGLAALAERIVDQRNAPLRSP